MNIPLILNATTLVLCIINYGLVLYSNKWDFVKMDSVGWLMAVLGWFNVIF
jgi:hypothetical protein